MSKMSINIIERCPKNKKEDYKYTLETIMHWIDSFTSESYADNHISYQSLNYIARWLFTTVTKLKNNLERNYNALVVKEVLYQEERSYVYFKTLNDAQNGKDYIESIILSVEMIGSDNIYQERKEKNKLKKENKKEKEIKEKFIKILSFKGKKGKMHIHHIGDVLKYDDEIINITLGGSDFFIFEFKSGELNIHYTSIDFIGTTLCIDCHYSFHID